MCAADQAYPRESLLARTSITVSGSVRPGPGSRRRSELRVGLRRRRSFRWVQPTGSLVAVSELDRSRARVLSTLSRTAPTGTPTRQPHWRRRSHPPRAALVPVGGHVTSASGQAAGCGVCSPRALKQRHRNLQTSPMWSQAEGRTALT
ncbi:hypothetical protein NDU88_005468 [Pleurodeles waltl]|uniref:Uncharacterized protein n=1 Tax=Pleurodeles waltl TaxID=8319 RepID=A0AAV7TB52_PLEWA|nr:hypothetical protein NDU88_005468 [Pleurodeles waltl]